MGSSACRLRADAELLLHHLMNDQNDREGLPVCGRFGDQHAGGTQMFA